MRTFRLSCRAVLACLLAGCARTADRDEVAICASAAAGLVTPVRVRVTGSAPLPRDAEGRSVVRLTLAPEDPDVALPWLVCRFAAGDTSPDLGALETAKGPVDETHLILLRRFWLGSEGAEAAEREEVARTLPHLSFRTAYVLQQALNALPDAAVYGLIAAAYSLIYG